MIGQKAFFCSELSDEVKKAERWRQKRTKLGTDSATNRMDLGESLIFSVLICYMKVTSDDRQDPQELYHVMILDTEIYLIRPEVHEFYTQH